MVEYFLNPGFLAGAALVSLPIIIHLFHRLRFRRVRWAAMEFLLESQRRNRRRLIFEQLLLLLLRCLLVAAVVILVARPLAGEGLMALLASGRPTEHIILLDDSYSMGQRQATTTVFAESKRAISLLVEELSRRPGHHKLTLLRTSRAGGGSGAEAQFDFDAVRLDPALGQRVQDLLKSLLPSYLAVGPEPALTAAARRVKEATDTGTVLYLATDFRLRDWPDPSPAAESLRAMETAGCSIHFIDAAERDAGNLGIDQISARLGSIAPEVPFVLEATVHNFSNADAESVAVTASVDKRPLPARVIEKIPANKSGKVRFDVAMPASGVHEIAIAIPNDSLPADDNRYLAVNLLERIPVLIVDGSADHMPGQYLAYSLAPGGSVRTGLDPTIRSPESLSTTRLEDFRVIYLLNVGRFAKPVAASLMKFVNDGGGLAIFLGDQVQAENYNDELQEAGLLPARLASVREIGSRSKGGPDILFEDHPVFRVFQGERNAFVEAVQVAKYFGVAPLEKPIDGARTIASTRDRQPLVVEGTHGAGRVMLFLTTVSPDWNNWARNPSFVVAMLEMQAYLAEAKAGAVSYPVGQPWTVRLNAAEDRRAIGLVRPAGAGETAEETIEGQWSGIVGDVVIKQTQLPGVYVTTKTSVNGVPNSVGRAYNVDPAEGNLTKIERPALEERLAGIKFRLHTAAEFEAQSDDQGFEPRDWLLALMILVLVCEQALAYRLSYHVR